MFYPTWWVSYARGVPGIHTGRPRHMVLPSIGGVYPALGTTHKEEGAGLG